MRLWSQGRVIPTDYLYQGRLEIENKNDSLGVAALRRSALRDGLDTTQVDLYGEIAKSLCIQLNKYEEAGRCLQKIWSEQITPGYAS